MVFTDAYIRNLKTVKIMEDFREKAGENFGVRAYPSGTKVFFYVCSFDGRQHYLNLGKYPACSLAGKEQTSFALCEYLNATLFRNFKEGGKKFEKPAAMAKLGLKVVWVSARGKCYQIRQRKNATYQPIKNI